MAFIQGNQKENDLFGDPNSAGSNDTLWGNGGNDHLQGGGGNNTLHGGTNLLGTQGGDWADYEMISPDTWAGAAIGVNVNLAAGIALVAYENVAIGVDKLIAIENVDGSNGSDLIVGDAKANILDGNGGDDIIIGMGGNDTLLGGNGSDELVGGTGTDTQDGEEGSDLYFWNAGDGRDVFNDSGPAYRPNHDESSMVVLDFDTIVCSGSAVSFTGLQKNFSIANGIEEIRHTFVVVLEDITAAKDLDANWDFRGVDTHGVAINGSVGEDNIIGTGRFENAECIDDDTACENPFHEDAPHSGYGETIHGFNDADTLQGADFNDTLFGDNGNDTLHGGIIDDETPATPDDQYVYRYTCDETCIEVNDGQDYLDGGAGNDTLDGGSGNDTLVGGSGNDVLIGGNGTEMETECGPDCEVHCVTDGDDSLSGGLGCDTLDGGSGNDNLDGGSANDVLNGGIGDDTLDGGAGRDTYVGGDGDDLFIVQSGETTKSIGTADRIEDFQAELCPDVDYRVGCENEFNLDYVQFDVSCDEISLEGDFADALGGGFVDALGSQQLGGIWYAAIRFGCGTTTEGIVNIHFAGANTEAQSNLRAAAFEASGPGPDNGMFQYGFC